MLRPSSPSLPPHAHLCPTHALLWRLPSVAGPGRRSSFGPPPGPCPPSLIFDFPPFIVFLASMGYFRGIRYVVGWKYSKRIFQPIANP
jgi:hypothetical protein